MWPLVLNTNLKLLEEFDELMTWYTYWWTTRNMEEKSQQDGLKIQGERQTDVGMMIVAKKWEKLKHKYSIYTVEVRELISQNDLA